MEPQRLPPLQQTSVECPTQITRCLFISNAAAANSKAMLSSFNITSVINATVDVVNKYYDGIQYVKIPVEDTPSSSLYNYFDPVADHIHTVGMKLGHTLLHCAAGVSRSAALCFAYLMKYHCMSLLQAYTWTKSCRPRIHPNNGFWEQLILYEYKLFNKNTVHMVSSKMGMIPDVYMEEAGSKVPK
ncbi:dual specificity protein phosphatase 18-like [Echinops telfairi]|uniref:Dual specificity protein phosphatase 18-like n=1 Tax=Echinops telfairi TaxID=9371 RepID=A0ABM0IZ63_ECHTE|nr:dual specificity protein phosphatase 18-like [Echinops telfairi]